MAKGSTREHRKIIHDARVLGQQRRGAPAPTPDPSKPPLVREDQVFQHTDLPALPMGVWSVCIPGIAPVIRWRPRSGEIVVLKLLRREHASQHGPCSRYVREADYDKVAL